MIIINGNQYVTFYPQQENETDEFRIKLQTLKTAMQNKSLVGNSVIHQYQTKLEETREFARTVETEKHHLEDKKKDVSRDYSQVAQAVKNLFTRCQATIRTKSMMAPPVTSMGAMSHIAPALTIAEDLDSELDVIYYRLTDLIEISEEFRSEGECGTDDSTVGSRSLQGPQTVCRSTVR
jgi:predicted nuclease with TOPRIM domain